MVGTITNEQADKVEADTRAKLLALHIEHGMDNDTALTIIDCAISVAKSTETALREYVTGRQETDDQFNELSVPIMLLAAQLVQSMAQQILESARRQAEEMGATPVFSPMPTMQ